MDEITKADLLPLARLLQVLIDMRVNDRRTNRSLVKAICNVFPQIGQEFEKVQREDASSQVQSEVEAQNIARQIVGRLESRKRG
jgi:hypothetical protein